MKVKDRIRKVDINKLSQEAINRLQDDLGKKIGKILDEAKLEADSLLNIYGCEIELGYEVKEKLQKSNN